MKRPNPRTKGRKEQNISCQSNNKKNDKVQKRITRATLGLQQNSKKTKKAEKPTIIVCYYRMNKKINQNRLEYKETPESSDDPSNALESASGGRAEREGDTESEAGSRL
uniref:Uncharacterized protein n=1 Tax=Felis catus TaxID=9685 RepID=A0ABI7ZRZ4_FELCA